MGCDGSPKRGTGTYGGLPMTSKEIVEAVAAELGDERRAQVAAAT